MLVLGFNLRKVFTVLINLLGTECDMGSKLELPCEKIGQDFEVARGFLENFWNSESQLAQDYRDQNPNTRMTSAVVFSHRLPRSSMTTRSFIFSLSFSPFARTERSTNFIR